ncbi:MAG: twin-arginine translocase subunit TatB [Pseudomonadales bacterium]|nr:twin-arginine translocase subunit TatB [Pseudomonadales bacterium]
MFDIGFGELLIIAVLGLLILGPERLPVAIKTIGLWVGRFKRSYRQIRSEIEHEIGADDIRRQLHNEEIMQSLENSKKQFDDLAHETQDQLDELKNIAKPTSSTAKEANSKNNDNS